jgi:hypothetical protein
VVGMDGPKHKIIGKGTIIQEIELGKQLMKLNRLGKEKRERLVQMHLDMATLLYFNGNF